MRFQDFLPRLLLLAALSTASTATWPKSPSDAPKPVISERTARQIAWSYGIMRIEEISLNGRFWEVAGLDEDDNERVIDINAHDGRVHE